ncbi:Nn.00g026580.m01.CDS01 [Neocucurbitaria sp. VM-36]
MEAGEYADIEMDPEAEHWYPSRRLTLLDHAQALADLPHTPPVHPNILEANRDAEILAARNKVVEDLPLDDEARVKLRAALDTSDLWPSCFRSDGPPANVPIDTFEKWSMADTRALLCIRRNCHLLPKIYGPLFFPNRGKEAAIGKWVKIVRDPPTIWDRANDEWLLHMFEVNGEQFEEFAKYFDGLLRAYDLELACAFVKNKKDNPRRSGKERAAQSMDEDMEGTMN